MSTAVATVSEAVDQYNSALAELLDAHAPAKAKSIKTRTPWYNNEIYQARRKRRRLAKSFSEFFISEIDTICAGLSTDASSSSQL